jgi:hypothetical protein
MRNGLLAQASFEKSCGRQIWMAVMRIIQRAIFVPLLSRPSLISAQAIHLSADVMHEMKIYLVSWRHSADTAANARRSKVIG